MLIEPCASVHTAFMRFTIDLVTVDRDGVVVKVVPALKPFRASGTLRGARAVIELPEGVIERTATVVGDKLEVEG